MSSSWFPGVVGSTAEVTTVSLFLATILGSMSLDFAVEAGVASHEFRFLGFGVLLSSASNVVNVCGSSGIEIHIISSLGGGVSVVFVLPVVVPPITASSGVVDLPRGKFECLEIP